MILPSAPSSLSGIPFAVINRITNYVPIEYPKRVDDASSRRRSTTNGGTILTARFRLPSPGATVIPSSSPGGSPECEEA
jgi:hypothetical protein